MGRWVDGAQAVRRAMDAAGGTLTDEQAVTMAAIFAPWDAAAHAYAAGGRVRHGGLLYRCLTPHTSQDDWRPGTAPSLWVRIDDPDEEWPAWRQPTGSTDAYAKGSKVSHSGKRWTSTADSNVWEPGIYGWQEQQ